MSNILKVGYIEELAEVQLEAEERRNDGSGQRVPTCISALHSTLHTMHCIAIAHCIEHKCTLRCVHCALPCRELWDPQCGSYYTDTVVIS